MKDKGSEAKQEKFPYHPRNLTFSPTDFDSKAERKQILAGKGALDMLLRRRDQAKTRSKAANQPRGIKSDLRYEVLNSLQIHSGIFGGAVWMLSELAPTKSGREGASDTNQMESHDATG